MDMPLWVKCLEATCVDTDNILKEMNKLIIIPRVGVGFGHGY